MDVSIIIINFNTKRLTQNCINSIIQNTKKVRYEIILIDNSSKKSERIKSILQFKNTKLIRIHNNGFSNGCNVGALNAKGKYLLMLNSDTIVHDNCIDKCFEYIENHTEFSALGCKIIDNEGKLDAGCKRGFPTPLSSLSYFLGWDKKFPNNKILGKYHATFISENKISQIEVISGAFFFIKNSVFKKLNGFDEDFFMYCEDIDLCYKMAKRKLKIVYYPFATITHFKGQSGLTSKNAFVIKNFYKSMLLFYKKQYKKKYNLFITMLVKLGIYILMYTNLLFLHINKKLGEIND